MKRIVIALLSILISSYGSFGQVKLLNIKSKKFKTSSGIKIDGQVGFLEVPENRKNPLSRKIKLKYVHLKSLSKNPTTPVIYLEGGGGVCTTEAFNPQYLEDRVEYLKFADFIFIDRRGASDKDLSYIWKQDFPKDFFVSEEHANQHYQELAELALKKFEEKNIDISGYNIEEHAHDVNDLMFALGFNRYTLFGFSFGSQIGMTVMELFPEKVERAILVGADAPNQSFNLPSHLDEHVKKIGMLVEQEGTLNMSSLDFIDLVHKTLQKVKENPVTVTVRNPLNRKKTELSIGAFGLALILRLDIDDSQDIPAIPRLLSSINSGDYSMLSWFVQKRMTFALELPGQGINQQLASAASPQRWSLIDKESSKSEFGNIVNFPFSALIDHWPETRLSFDSSIAMQTEIPTLFITGKLDCRTPVQQTEEIMRGFTNAVHIQVENAGHEQAQWEQELVDTIIPSFMIGECIRATTVYYPKLKFIPLSGEGFGHPSIR